MRYNVGDKVVLKLSRIPIKRRIIQQNGNVATVLYYKDGSFLVEENIFAWSSAEIDHEATAKLKEDKMKTYNLIEVMNSEEGTEFECGNGNVYFTRNGQMWSHNGIRFYVVTANKSLANAQFTLVQPKIKLSDDEKVILRNLDPEYKWIARDLNKNLYAYECNPEKHNTYFLSDGDYKGIKCFEKIFNSITFENSPHLIADLIKE